MNFHSLMLEIKRKVAMSLIIWRNSTFKKVLSGFSLNINKSRLKKSLLASINTERNLLLSETSNNFLKIVIKEIVRKSSVEIEHKEKMMVNLLTRSEKALQTARIWYTKLRNRILVKRLEKTLKDQDPPTFRANSNRKENAEEDLISFSGKRVTLVKTTGIKQKMTEPDKEIQVGRLDDKSENLMKSLTELRNKKRAKPIHI